MSKICKKLWRNFSVDAARVSILQKYLKADFTTETELLKSVQKIYSLRVSAYTTQQHLKDQILITKFTNRTEKFIIEHQCSPYLVEVYAKLKEMDILQHSMKHNVNLKLEAYLKRDESLNNQYVELFLWFLYYENPFEQDLFIQLADLHTLTLIEMYQKMSQFSKMPAWSPYIRVSHMLRLLGHPVPIRQDISTQQELLRINYKLYPFVLDFFSKEEGLQITTRERVQEQFSPFMLMQYFTRNTVEYGEYLNRLQRINMDLKNERTFDVMDWSQFVNALKMMRRVEKQWGEWSSLEKTLADLFVRLILVYPLELQAAIAIVDILTSGPNLMIQKRHEIMASSFERFSNRDTEQWAFLPANAYISLLKTSDRIQQQEYSAQPLREIILKSIPYKRIWKEGDCQKLITALQESQIESKFIGDTLQELKRRLAQQDS